MEPRHDLQRHVRIHGLAVICIALLVAFPPIATWFPETLQAAARSQKIPEEHQKIIDQQRKNTKSLEDDALK